MYKTLLAMFLILAACADIPDVDEADEEIDSVEQASLAVYPPAVVFAKPAVADSWFTPMPNTRYTYWYTTMVPYGVGSYAQRSYLLDTATNGGKLQLKLNGAYNSCVYANGNPNIWDGMWCDGHWTQCPGSSYLAERTFALWNVGFTGSTPNYNWFEPGSNTQNNHYDLVGVSDNAGFYAPLAQPKTINVGGGKVSFVCNYVPPSSFSFRVDEEAWTAGNI